MQTMNISLPEPLEQFVDGQISTRRYSSASEYVRELIRADETIPDPGRGERHGPVASVIFNSTWRFCRLGRLEPISATNC